MNYKVHRFWAFFWGFGLTIGWIYYILTNQLPELYNTPYQARIDLVAEFILSVGLIFVGFQMKEENGNQVKKMYLFFLGMFLFSAIGSVAFFVQDEWLTAAIQWILFLIWSIWATIDVYKSKN